MSNILNMFTLKVKEDNAVLLLYIVERKIVVRENVNHQLV